MHLWTPDLPIWNLAVRGVVVYAAVIVLLRLGGKRQVGQMGIWEFVALLLISNAVQNSMNGGDNSLTGGLILAVVIIAQAALYTYLTYRSRRLEMMMQGRPTLLVHRGQILTQNLEKEWLSVRELRQLLRKQGVTDLADVQAAILESDGFVSITRLSEAAEERRDIREFGPPRKRLRDRVRESWQHTREGWTHPTNHPNPPKTSEKSSPQL